MEIAILLVSLHLQYFPFFFFSGIIIEIEEKVMHQKAIDLVKKYNDLGEKMSQMNPAGQEYVKVAKDRAELEPLADIYNEIEKIDKEIAEAKAMMDSNEDDDLKKMAKEEVETLAARKTQLEKDILVILLPKDEMASRNIVMEIRAGTGGDEAALFAGDLFRMYTRYAEIKKWKVEVLDFHEIGLGGYKEVVLEIRGKEVYERLKFESGVHRVQRVPATEASGRVHTSTASVVVLPEATEVDVTIDPKDLQVDTFRAGGAGGQYVNKTESAVRITHIPSGIVVGCQEERSQIQNRVRAMTILRSRLLDMEMQKQTNAQTELRRSAIRTGDRSEKIRTYNYSQNRVTDHRINVTLYKLDQIMEGGCEELFNACLMSEQEELLKSLE